MRESVLWNENPALSLFRSRDFDQRSGHQAEGEGGDPDLTHRETAVCLPASEVVVGTAAAKGTECGIHF